MQQPGILASDPVPINICISRMNRSLAERLIGAADGIVDHVNGFSTCIGGGWYVIPPIDALQ